MEHSCRFCDSYERAKQINEFNRFSDGHRHDAIYSVAFVKRYKIDGRIQNSRVTDYRYRGVGYALNFCPECGRSLRKGGKSNGTDL